VEGYFNENPELFSPPSRRVVNGSVLREDTNINQPRKISIRKLAERD
jgi:hypothetical protein